MAFTTESYMPGAYGFDAATPSGQPLSATVFRPPMSPSASSSVYNLAKSTGSLYSDVAMASTPALGVKRKRARAEAGGVSTPSADWNTNINGASDAREEARPTAAAEGRRYILAGQIETPNGAPVGAEHGILGLEDSAYSDIDYRRAIGSKRERDELESPSIQFSGLRLDTPAPVTPRRMGWSTVALSTIGGVVGKVWEFCTTAGFRGFQAGGGERYGLNGISTPTKGGRSSQNGRPWCNEHDVATLETDDLSPNEHIPGSFPQSEYVSLHELSTPDSTPRPAVKRRQTSATNGDELRRNWVMVNEPSPSAPAAAPLPPPPFHPPSSASSLQSNTSIRPGMTRSGPHQPRYSSPTASSVSRRISVPHSRLGSATPSAVSRSTRSTRTSLRVSHAGSPALSARPTASYASPRSPNHDVPSSPSRIPLPTNPTTTNPFAIPGTTTLPRPASRQAPRQQRSISRCASPAPLRPGSHNSTSSHRRNVSTGSASSARLLKGGNTSPPNGAQDSPRLTAEAKQLAAKKMAAERDADAKMEAFNRKLMDMIRQGKEALGTTVEVEMEMGAPTAGWEDE